jgi:hypothetical protein
VHVDGDDLDTNALLKAGKATARKVIQSDLQVNIERLEAMFLTSDQRSAINNASASGRGATHCHTADINFVSIVLNRVGLSVASPFQKSTITPLMAGCIQDAFDKAVANKVAVDAGFGKGAVCSPDRNWKQNHDTSPTTENDKVKSAVKTLKQIAKALGLKLVCEHKRDQPDREVRFHTDQWFQTFARLVRRRRLYAQTTCDVDALVWGPEMTDPNERISGACDYVQKLLWHAGQCKDDIATAWKEALTINRTACLDFATRHSEHLDLIASEAFNSIGSEDMRRLTAEQQNTVLDLATNAVASDALPETFRVSTQSLLKAREAKSEFLQQQPGVDAMAD